MDTDISVNNLSTMLKSERKTGEILPLKPDFFTKVGEKLNTYDKNSDEYKNMLKITNTIKERRTQKLLVYLAYNKDIPRPVPTEEEDLYIQIKNILNKTGADARLFKLKVSKSIPQIVAPSGNKIGPFEQNEIVSVSDRADAKFMVENSLGETID